VTSHELARLLLTLPDLPVATSAHGHVYSEEMHRSSHGPLEFGRLHTYAGEHLVVGNMVEYIRNKPNYYTTDILGVEARPEEGR